MGGQREREPPATRLLTAMAHLDMLRTSMNKLWHAITTADGGLLNEHEHRLLYAAIMVRIFAIPIAEQ
jgi:hypothetical protein